MKNIQDVQFCIKNKNEICLIFDYEGVLSSYANTFSADSFNPMIKRILENYAKKSYIKVVILLDKDEKKVLKKLKMSAPNLEFCNTEEVEIENLYENMDERMQIIYFGDNLSVMHKVKDDNGVVICLDCLSEEVRKLSNFSLSKSKLEEFIIQTNNLYL